MAEFDRNLLIENIYRLAKEKKLKIGDLESSVGVSTGYLSRLAKDESKGVFSAELLFQIADKLGTTMDSLVLVNTKGLTDNEQYLLSFIERLTLETENYGVEWNMMEPMIEDTTYLFDHPLFRKVDKDGEDMIGNYHTWEAMQYDSLFLESGTAYINGNCFYTRIDDFSQTDLYIMNVYQCGGQEKYASEKPIYEIYFIKRGSVEGVECSAMVCDQLKAATSRLYKAIDAARSHLTVDSSVKSVMDRFMKRGESK